MVEREDDVRGPRPASIICPPGFLFLRAGARGSPADRPMAPPVPARRAFPFSGRVRAPASAASLPRRRHACRGVSGRAAAGGRGGAGPCGAAMCESLSANEKVATVLDCTVLLPPSGKNKAIGERFIRSNDNLSARLARERG